MRIEKIRTGFADRLRSRRSEIEQAGLARIYAVSDSTEVSDPEYLDGLKVAVSAALEYGIEAVARNEDRPPPMPTALLAQARLAARYGVKLETVLRRYLAGYTLLSDFIIEEAEKDGLMNGASLKRLLRGLGVLFDRLVAAVSEEYERETSARPGSSGERRLERVERLLAGELVDTAELAYDLDAHHLGAIAVGPRTAAGLGQLAKSLECRHLIVQRNEQTVWAWFASRRRLDAGEVEGHLPADWPDRASLAVGETGEAFSGWRLTHQQAQAALPIARASASKLTRYADVALLASLRQDEVLAASLQRLYLAPLARAHDGGAVLRSTLRAYFATGRNVSSAAAVLNVNRRTVTNRLRTVEEYVGRPFDDCAVDLQMSLQLAELP